MIKYILVPVYLFLTTAGMTLMKLGGNTGTLSIKEGNFMFGMSLISALGFLCYIASFLFYTKIISFFDLSYIYPLCAAIVQILTLVVAAFILKEKISIQGVIGTIIIIIGIVVMNIKVPVK